MDVSQYAELFLTESREHLSAINRALLELEHLLTPGDAGSESSASSPAALDTAAAAMAEVNSSAIDSLFRAVHTIKGMSATMGYDAVAALSHEMEALLDQLRQRRLAAHAELLNALFTAADTLESSIERAVATRPADPRVDAVVERLRSFASAPDSPPSVRGRSAGGRKRRPATGGPLRKTREARKPVASRRTPRPGSSALRKSSNRAGPRAPAVSDAAPPRRPVSETLIRIRFVVNAPLRGARATLALQRALSLGEITLVHPSPETFTQEGPGPDALEIRIRTEVPVANVEQEFAGVGDVASVDVIRPAPRRTGPRKRVGGVDGLSVPRITDLALDRARSAAGSVRSATESGASHPIRPASRRSVAVAVGGDGIAESSGDGISRARHVRIDLRRLDALMNLIGELVIARGRLAELTSSEGDTPLAEAVGLASRLIGDLQEEIMTCRMVPVWQVFDRFPRLVRDAAHSLGKQVTFEVEGKDIS